MAPHTFTNSGENFWPAVCPSVKMLSDPYKLCKRAASRVSALLQAARYPVDHRLSLCSVSDAEHQKECPRGHE